MRAVDGFLGLTCMFGVASYVSRKLRKAVAEREAMLGTVSTFA